MGVDGCHVHLQQTLNAVQPFQDELVSSIKLDAGFPVDTFGAEFRAELAFWLGAITPRLAGPAYFTLQLRVSNWSSSNDME